MSMTIVVGLLSVLVVVGLLLLWAILRSVRVGQAERPGEGGEREELLRRLLREEFLSLSCQEEDRMRAFRGEISESLRGLSDSLAQALSLSGERLMNRLGESALLQEQFSATLRGEISGNIAVLAEKNERSMTELRQAVEGRLDVLRVENSQKLDQMRMTVDERLQKTLEARLGESFTRVVEQLERVHKSLGEMQTLAVGVGDLKRVLSNVKTRGMLGEVQLGALLEQFLAPEQFVKNVRIKPQSQERVEFAIRLPGKAAGDEEGSEVLLPVDAKFPVEDYERLQVAVEGGDLDGIARATRELESRIRLQARTIREKYVDPPKTTDFALMFLPTEGLFAEVLRIPGLFEQIQRNEHITLVGPTTLSAILSALQMGFRTLAIERRSGEVWRILGAVRHEFTLYNEVVERLSSQLSTAARQVDKLGTRTRAMHRKLREVDTLPEAEAREILGEALPVEPGGGSPENWGQGGRDPSPSPPKGDGHEARKEELR